MRRARTVLAVTLFAGVATRGRLVVQAVGIRDGDVQGFTNDSDDMIATKVYDVYDVYDVSGRMPPAVGASDWR